MPGLVESIFQDRDSRILLYYIVLSAACMVLEIGYGFMSNSLGLISVSENDRQDAL